MVVVVTSVLAFYSDDPSLSPAVVYYFSVKLLLERLKIYKKRLELGHFMCKLKPKICPFRHAA